MDNGVVAQELKRHCPGVFSDRVPAPAPWSALSCPSARQALAPPATWVPGLLVSPTNNLAALPFLHRPIPRSSWPASRPLVFRQDHTPHCSHYDKAAASRSRLSRPRVDPLFPCLRPQSYDHSTCFSEPRAHSFHDRVVAGLRLHELQRSQWPRPRFRGSPQASAEAIPPPSAPDTRRLDGIRDCYGNN